MILIWANCCGFMLERKTAVQFNHILCSLKILQVFRVKVLTDFTLETLSASSYDLILTPFKVYSASYVSS